VGFILALNVALIFGCCVCTGLLVLEITGRYGNNLGACPAVWAGLLVAVHPFSIHAAQSPQELAALSCLFFSLVSIFAMMRYRLISEFRYFAIAVMAFILSLLSGDRAVLIPVVLSSSFVIPDGITQPNKIGKSISRALKLSRPFLVLAIIYVALRPAWWVDSGIATWNPQHLDLLWTWFMGFWSQPFPSHIHEIFFAVGLVVLARILCAKSAKQTFLFLLGWLFLTIQPSPTGSLYFSIPPMCAFIALSLLPALDRTSKDRSIVLTAVGSVLLLALFSFWAMQSIF